ncbi:GNAT family N-acetyltransferase [Actinoplanes sp. NPDC020271]|uniref:GNAT family N-acetyltransferase n=1 Tax=Actinoplanes sp. NPDC020271 TaxID=3363896 RepID=UPI0037A4F74B
MTQVQAGLRIEAGGYTVIVADERGVVQAQRLRRQVFAEEFGTMIDVDAYDEHCDHIVVRHDASDTVVGTYRMMTADCAAAVGGRYGQRTFDLRPLRDLDAGLVETGRAAVHLEHRNGAVVGLMWAGIAQYLKLAGRSWLGGCAWVKPDLAAGIWAAVRDRHLAPAEFRVEPRHPVLRTSGPEIVPGAVPPLLRGYLRLGSWVCGEPSYDTEAGVATFYVLLSVDQMNPRYRRHFFSSGE